MEYTCHLRFSVSGIDIILLAAGDKNDDENPR
jgi:hypothetical protein